jgi:energy-coupling factor transporter ATP-binding protein EcfA2
MERSIDNEERYNQIQHIVSLLSLDKCLKTMIGQLSGGERKRLAFATVLLTDPSIVLIDEPTSGLDSYLAKELMKMIRTMAIERRRTIIVVLHQPTNEMFSSIDSLCLLIHGGRLAFFGAKHEADTYFSSECGLLTSSLDNTIELLAAPPKEDEQILHLGSQVADQFVQSSHAKVLFDDILSLQQPFHQSDYDESKWQWRSSFFRQFRWLLWRSIKAGSRNPAQTVVVLIRTIIPAFFFSLIYYSLHHSAEFAHNINALSIVVLSVTTNSCIFLTLSTVPLNVVICIKEYNRRIYRISAYYISTVISNLPVFILMPLLFSSVLFWVANVDDSFSHYVSFVGTVILTSNFGGALGAFSSSFWSSVESAIATTIPVVQILYLCSGFFVSLRHVPSIFRFIQYISPFYYGYSTLYELEWSFTPLDGVRHYYRRNGNYSTANQSSLYVWRSGEKNEQQIAFHSQITFNVVMSCLLYIVFHLFAFTIIWFRAHKIRLTTSWKMSGWRATTVELCKCVRSN